MSQTAMTNAAPAETRRASRLARCERSLRQTEQ
jgi:hypothetical protein